MNSSRRLLRIVGLTFAIGGAAAIMGVIVYAAQSGTANASGIIVGFPSLVMAVLLWKERSLPWLFYLSLLSAACGAFGLWYTIQRTMIHYHTTLSGMPEFATLEGLFLIPPLMRYLFMILSGVARKRTIKVVSIGLLLLLAIFYFTENENIRFGWEPKDWRFSLDDMAVLSDTNGRISGTMIKFHVGPIVVVRYGDWEEQVITNVPAMPNNSDAHEPPPRAAFSGAERVAKPGSLPVSLPSAVGDR